MSSSGAGGDRPPKKSIMTSLFRNKKKVVTRGSSNPATTSSTPTTPTTPTTTPLTTAHPITTPFPYTYEHLRQSSHQYSPSPLQQPSQQPSQPEPSNVGTAAQDMRIYIEPAGNTFNPHAQATQKMTSLIRSNFDTPHKSWKFIPFEVREMWFREFECSFYWLPEYSVRIRKNFEKTGSKRMRDMFTDIRKKGEKPVWIGEHVWDELCNEWRKADYEKMCAQNKQNRSSDSGGFVTSLSTCGSRPLTEYKRLMTAELGREPTLPELHERTHKKKGTDEWVDDRARHVHDEYARLKEQHSQPSLGDGSSAASSHMPSDLSLWKQAAGGKNMGRTYGLGSQGPAFDAMAYHASPSDYTGMHTYDIHRRLGEMEAQQQQCMEQMEAKMVAQQKQYQLDMTQQQEKHDAQQRRWMDMMERLEVQYPQHPQHPQHPQQPQQPQQPRQDDGDSSDDE